MDDIENIRRDSCSSGQAYETSESQYYPVSRQQLQQHQTRLSAKKTRRLEANLLTLELSSNGK